MRTLVNWTPEGVFLEDFIKQNTTQLEKARIFYVIQANSDNEKVTKIGIAGTKSGRAIARLTEYVHFHGYNNLRNTAQGVKIIACYYTEYNPKVYSQNSAVYIMEKAIKNEMKFKNNAKALKRGGERSTFTLRHLYQLLADRNLHKDVEIETRKSTRLKETPDYTDAF